MQYSKTVNFIVSFGLKATAANGDTALHLAARRRDVDMVRILVDYGTNVDTQNGEGQTPLHIAAAEGDEALLKYFYGVRASASIADNQGNINYYLFHPKLTNYFIFLNRSYSYAFGC